MYPYLKVRILDRFFIWCGDEDGKHCFCSNNKDPASGDVRIRMRKYMSVDYAALCDLSDWRCVIVHT